MYTGHRQRYASTKMFSNANITETYFLILNTHTTIDTNMYEESGRGYASFWHNASGTNIHENSK